MQKHAHISPPNQISFLLALILQESHDACSGILLKKSALAHLLIKHNDTHSPFFARAYPHRCHLDPWIPLFRVGYAVLVDVSLSPYRTLALPLSTTK